MNNNLKKEVKSFWVDGLSISETKVSTLILCLVISLGVGISGYISFGDFPPGVVETIKYLVFGIAGVNVGKEIFSSSKEETISQSDIDELT
ncbi:MAG: hypothetical protein ACOCP8_01815 [archaeon]